MRTFVKATLEEPLDNTCRRLINNIVFSPLDPSLSINYVIYLEQYLSLSDSLYDSMVKHRNWREKILF